MHQTLGGTKELLEKVTPTEDLKRLKASPEDYDDYLKSLDNSTIFHRRALDRLAGIYSIENWGEWLLKPFSEDTFEEAVAWKDHPDYKLRATVYSILNLYIEDKRTPDRIIKEKIMPIIAKKRANPDVDSYINDIVEECFFAEKLRFANAAEQMKILTEKVQADESLYAMKLLSVSGSTNAVEFLGHKKSDARFKVFEEIAVLNHGIMQHLQPDKGILEAVIIDRTKQDSTRIYALRRYCVINQLQAVPFVITTYKEQRSKMSPYLNSEFKKVIEEMEGIPDLDSKLKAIGVDAKVLRF